jgi:5-methylcytosine-specific restriction endonuclease McrA
MPEIWYRVFYRNGKGEPVLGEAELARRLARKTPIIIYHEIALIHRCQHCGQRGPWTKDWRCYPVLKHHPERVQARAGGAAEYVVCSAACWDAMLERMDPPHWMNINQEPRPIPMRQALHQATIAEWSRKREALDYRKAPLPEWRGDGFCKWCNGRMQKSDKPRIYWHAKCSRQWELHGGFLLAQIRFLRKRDGDLCAMPGCDRPGCEVDHRRPLWSVRDLPPMIRRVFYGPRNLWLLCSICHAAKTKREAAERAAQRR